MPFFQGFFASARLSERSRARSQRFPYARERACGCSYFRCGVSRKGVFLNSACVLERAHARAWRSAKSAAGDFLPT